MKKRIFSFIMALIMVFTMLPVNAIAVTADGNGNAVYEIGDTVWVRGEEAEPTGVTVDKAFWIPVYDENDQPVTKQGLCGLTEHSHSYACAEDCALAHTHSEECYSDVYVGCAIHAHGEDCVTETVYSCGVEAHSHENCTASEKCTLEEHDHAACETAVSFTCETEEHTHAACPSEVVYTCQEEHIHEMTACGGTVNYLCGKNVHTHSVEADCAYENVFTCGKAAHTHGDGSCVMETSYDCGKAEHSHENCTAVTRYVGCAEHLEHNENCTSEKQLICGKDEHTCVTEGCAADCAIAEHTHTAECDMEGVYYQWMVVEDTSSTYAQRGLPLHFFIAEPGQQVYPDGDYVNYREDLWGASNYNSKPGGAYANDGAEDNSQIRSTQGIRNANDESLITTHVFKWPDGYDANTLKDFGSITIDGVTYSQNDYEIKWVTICYRSRSAGLYCYCGVSYEHIHIDGILTKKIEPGEMNLFKEIPAPQAQDETFNFTLTRLNQDSSYNPMNPSNPNNIDRTFGNNGSINLTASIEKGQTKGEIVGTAGTEIGFGYYMLTEVPNDRWQASAIEIERENRNPLRYTTNTVFIQIATDGTVKYSNTYNGNYTTGESLTVENQRSALEVTYQWRVYNLDGGYDTELPESLGAFGLPAKVTGVAHGTEFTYNTGYVQGTSYYDYENGLLYTFHGWDTWSHSSEFNTDPTAEGYNRLDDGDANAANNPKIPITEDTWINGYWSVDELDPSDAYLMVKKVVVGDTDVNNYLNTPQNKLFVSIDPGADKNGDDAAQVDVDYPALTATDGEGNVIGKRIDVYQYDIPFVFEEKQAEIPGYTRSTVISTDGTNLALISEDGTVTGDIGYVSIDPKFTPSAEPYNLGTVIYTNTYTKNTSEEGISVYPRLTLNKTDYNYTGLTGAQFTLYSDADCTTAVGNPYVTVEGELYIDFAASGLGAGTYYLKETGAPEGFVLPENVVYTIAVSEKETKEELRGDTFYEVTYYTLTVEIPEDAEAEFSITASQSVETSADWYTLHVYNAPILGELHVSKTTSGLADEDKAGLSATVIVHGPVIRDENDAITGVGNTWTLILDEENEWQDAVFALPLGEYLIHESFASVHGYTWNGVTYGALTTTEYNGITSGVFKVTDSTPIALELTNTYEEWNAADFYIKKVNAGGTALAGAEFQLFSDAECKTPVLAKNVTNYAVTGADGYAHFTGFEVAEGKTIETYYLKEVKAPAGYYLSGTVYKVEIKAVTANNKTTYEPRITALDSSTVSFDNTTDLLTVTNNPVLGQLTVKKTFTDNVIPSGLTSITATVTGTGYSNAVTLNAENGWEKTLTDLPLGTYTVTEQNANVPGYTLTTTYKVGETETAQAALAESNPGYTAEGTTFGNTVEIINDYERNEETYEVPTSLVIKKVGEDGTTGLPGAQFTLTRERDGHAVTFTTGTDGSVVFDMLSGTISNGAPVDGTYTLKETAAPAGYAKADITWTVTVEENDGKVRIELNEDKNIFENIWDWIVGGITGNKNEGMYSFAAATETDPATLKVKNAELADMTISKTITGATAPAGAVIEVAVLDAAGKLYEQVELTAAKNWTYTVENMPAGKYTVAEVTGSLHGYTWTSAEFDVDGAETKAGAYDNSVEITVVDSAEISVAIENKYTQWTSADFWVFKAKDDGTSPLSGATFKLYHDAALTNDVTGKYLDETITGNSTTGTRGVVHFQGFVVAEGQTDTFYLKETAAPDNYYLRDTVYTVTVSHDEAGYDVVITDAEGKEAESFNGANDVLTVVNTEILGNLTIQKAFGDGNAFEPGYVRVDVTGPNGYSQEVVLSRTNGWKTTLKDLHLGEYTITEQDAYQAGYNLAVAYNTQKVTLTAANDSDEAVDVLITNTYTKNEDKHTPASFEILKVDENGQALAGAEFTLTAAGREDIVVTTDSNGKAKFENLQGNLVNGKPENVTYTLTETEAPYGYKLSETTWSVIVKEDDGVCRIVLNEESNLFENIWDWITGNTNSTSETWSWNNNVLTVENEAIKGQLNLTKAYEGVVDIGNARAEIHVHGPITRDANERITDIGPLVKTITLENGVTTGTAADLALGEYVLREPFASIHGYTWTGAVYEINGEPVELETYNGLPEFAAFTVDGDSEAPVIDVALTNNYTVWQEADFYVNKVKDLDDLSEGLPGAKFELYSDAEMTKLVQYQITGMAGYAHFTGFTVPEGMDSVTYWLKETEAPKNYYLSDTVWKVEIGHDAANGTFTTDISLASGEADVAWSWNGDRDVLDVENEEILGKLTIVKEFADNVVPEGIESITVHVAGPESYRNTVTLTAPEWEKEITGLKLGEYTVTEDTELAQVLGYTLEGTAYSLTGGVVDIADDAGDAVTITNTYVRNDVVINNPDSVTIYKTDDLGNALSGAVFTLSDGRTFTTGADGKVEIDNLIGTGTLAGQSSKIYILEETTAPAGHVKSEAQWEIEVVENDGKVHINLNAQKNAFENIWDWIVGNIDPDGKWNEETETLTVVNPRKTTKVEVSKEVVFQIEDENDPLVKAHADREYKFRLSYLDDDDELVTEVIRVKGGQSKTFEAEIPYGTAYKVDEITEADFFNGELSNNSEGVVNGEALIEIEAVNTYIFEETDGLDIDFVKVAADKKATTLKGAKFSLYDAAGKLVGTYTSDKYGEFTIDEISAPGAYTLKETQAPDGYYKLKKAIEIDVDYEYTTKTVDGKTVIVRTLVAEVSGKGVYERTDGSYGIKNTEITDNPKTGDQFNMGLWVGIGGFAAAALIVLLILGKKKGKK